jgi:hypothetical protein
VVVFAWGIWLYVLLILLAFKALGNSGSSDGTPDIAHLGNDAGRHINV